MRLLTPLFPLYSFIPVRRDFDELFFQKGTEHWLGVTKSGQAIRSGSLRYVFI